MIYVHCNAPSEGAVLLAETLRGIGLPTRRSRDDATLHKRLDFQRDLIIGWGELIPFAGVKVLNGRPTRTKLAELEILHAAGIPVPPFDTYNWGEGWIGRSMHHQEGGDFLPPSQRPPAAFWTRKLDIVEEFRFHVFHLPKGFKSIRAGKKVPRTTTPHPWVRSWQHGWKISYSPDHKINKKAREVAKLAIEAVGYDFGAVDVGVLRGGEVVVLEVNSRVGFDIGGQTVMKYAEAVKKVVEEGR